MSVRRTAEDMVVTAWGGWPLRITVERADLQDPTQLCITVEEAEGLHYALGKVLEEVKAEERRREPR